MAGDAPECDAGSGAVIGLPAGAQIWVAAGVTAIYPPDFDDTDPVDANWNEIRDPAAGEKLTNREVIAAVLFAITAPRVCAYPTIVLDNMSRK
jgi:hypothetical protein